MILVAVPTYLKEGRFDTIPISEKAIDSIDNLSCWMVFFVWITEYQPAILIYARHQASMSDNATLLANRDSSQFVVTGANDRPDCPFFPHGQFGRPQIQDERPQRQL